MMHKHVLFMNLSGECVPFVNDTVIVERLK